MIPFPDNFIERQNLNHCQLCTRRIQEGAVLTIYCSNKNWAAEHSEIPSPIPQRSYCPYCRRRSILVPHRGTAEALLMGVLDKSEDGLHFSQKGMIDTSVEDSGIEWDPLYLYDEIIPPREFPHSEKVPTRRGLNPATVYDEFYIHGVRLESFAENGKIDLSGEVLGTLRHSFDENQERRSRRRAAFLFRE